MGEVFAGRYELVDLLGQGGMGAVWRAWDHRQRAYTAAKVLRQADAASLIRFVREQALRIPHEHVVAPRSWAAEDERVLFTMDLVGGGSVSTLVGDHGPLPAAYACCLLDQVLSGLEAIHSAGVVHRDLKPANLLLEATGAGVPHVRVSDFGISLRIGEPRLTETSLVVGTPGYLAPEQLRGADPSPVQDLYSIGVIGIELLTGERAERTDAGAPLLPTDRPAQVDHRLWDLLSALTAQHPADRPGTAGQARPWLSSLGVLPEPGQPLHWRADGDPIEVLQQIPELPSGWGPAGPLPRPGRVAGPGGPSQPSTVVRTDQPVSQPGQAGSTVAEPHGPGPGRAVPAGSGAAAPTPAVHPPLGPHQPGNHLVGAPSPGQRAAGAPPSAPGGGGQAAPAGPPGPAVPAGRPGPAVPAGPPGSTGPAGTARLDGRSLRPRRRWYVPAAVAAVGAVAISALVVVPAVQALLDDDAPGPTGSLAGTRCSATDVTVLEHDEEGNELECRRGEDGAYTWRRAQ